MSMLHQARVPSRIHRTCRLEASAKDGLRPTYLAREADCQAGKHCALRDQRKKPHFHRLAFARTLLVRTERKRVLHLKPLPCEWPGRKKDAKWGVEQRIWSTLEVVQRMLLRAHGQIAVS